MSADNMAPGRSKSKPGFKNTHKPSILSRLRAMFEGRPAKENIAAAIDNGDQEVVQSQPAARREMIERVVAFDKKSVVDVMTPRADIYAVDIDTSFKELIRIFTEAGHSRMPVYRSDLDDPVGMVHIKDAVGLIANNVSREIMLRAVLKEIRREILYVPPSMRITDLLLRMQASRIHMALVIDEYGGTDGLVTIEDLVEEIVGEINDEHDKDETAAVTALSGGGWDVDARVELEEFEKQTGFRLEADEEDEIDTVGGYVVSIAGRVPQRGEVLSGEDGFDFEVIEADARKVRKLRIRPSSSRSTEAAE